MKHLKISRLLAMVSLVLAILGIPLAGAGCTEGDISGITATGLAATMVPPVDLDVYIYVNQQVPTKVPASWMGMPADISVQSLAIWGIVNDETQYAFGGALTFSSAAEAGAVLAKLPKMTYVYTKQSDRTVYFVQGSGGPAESIQTAIATNNFTRYNDKAALAEVARLPSGNTTKPGIIGIIKPDKDNVDVVKQYVDKNTAATIDSTFSSAKPGVIAFGVFSSQPIDLADLVRRISNNTALDLDLGVVLSIDSAYPGLVFGPIANRAIGNMGFPEVKVGDLTAYKYSADIGNGKIMPVYINVSGNHVFVTASGKEEYAQTLLMSIKR